MIELITEATNVVRLLQFRLAALHTFLCEANSLAEYQADCYSSYFTCWIVEQEIGQWRPMSQLSESDNDAQFLGFRV
jgi:hypothetical protein